MARPPITPESSEIAAAAVDAKADAAQAAAAAAAAVEQQQIAAAKTRLGEFFGDRLNPTALTYTHVGSPDDGSVIADDGVAALAVRPDGSVWPVVPDEDGDGWRFATGEPVPALDDLADVILSPDDV